MNGANVTTGLVIVLALWLPFISVAHQPHPAGAPAHPVGSPGYHEVTTNTDESVAAPTVTSAQQQELNLLLQLVALLQEQLNQLLGIAATDDSDASASDTTNTTVAVDTDVQPVCGDFAGTYTDTITDESAGGTHAHYVDISVSGDECVIVTNQIPSHDIGGDSSFAGKADEVRKTFRVPAEPEVASTPTPVAGYAKQGAVMLEGVKWDSGPAACFAEGTESLGREKIGCHPNNYHPWRYEVGSSFNGFGVDEYNAHVQPDGSYHYHASPVAGFDADCSSETDRAIIGFAMDGFPVFGCYIDDTGEVRKAESSYALKSGERAAISGYTTPYQVGGVRSDDYNGQFTGDYEYVAGSGDLDECNGADVDGVYGYYVTNTYPYVLSCFTGTPSN